MCYLIKRKSCSLQQRINKEGNDLSILEWTATCMHKFILMLLQYELNQQPQFDNVELESYPNNHGAKNEGMYVLNNDNNLKTNWHWKFSKYPDSTHYLTYYFPFAIFSYSYCISILQRLNQLDFLSRSYLLLFNVLKCICQSSTVKETKQSSVFASLIVIIYQKVKN